MAALGFAEATRPIAIGQNPTITKSLSGFSYSVGGWSC